MIKQRGRPKGRSRDTRSFGPLGDLLRKARLEKGLGLSDVANACECSVQFISNIEHGRAPLPWEKVESLANYLKIAVEELQAANLAIRSDFKTIVGNPSPKRGKESSAQDTSSATAIALSVIKDTQLRQFVERYLTLGSSEKKRALIHAAKAFN